MAQTFCSFLRAGGSRRRIEPPAEITVALPLACREKQDARTRCQRSFTASGTRFGPSIFSLNSGRLCALSCALSCATRCATAPVLPHSLEVAKPGPHAPYDSAFGTQGNPVAAQPVQRTAHKRSRSAVEHLKQSMIDATSALFGVLKLINLEDFRYDL